MIITRLLTVGTLFLPKGQENPGRRRWWSQDGWYWLLFFLSTNLKEEFPGWECGEAKQGVQLLVWAELGQVQPSLSVVLLCVPWQLFLRLFLNYENTKRKWLPTLVIWAGDGICLAPDWPWPWYCGCHLHWAWLPTLCWCGLSVLWLSQCAAKYIHTIKGYRSPMSGSVWRDAMDLAPLVSLWILLVGMKKNINTLVWTGLTIPMSQPPRHSQMTSGERRENSQRMTLAKAVSSKLNMR